EHAVLHLLYARFWHKVLFDLGHVSAPEPFFKLVNQGLILGEDGQKMSKSRGNVINPDEVLKEYGADAFRLYEMFMGPLEMVKPFAPHLAEELFPKLQGRSGDDMASSMAYEPWPKYNPALLIEATLEIPVQVNGKLRDRIAVNADATQEEIEKAALACEKIKP